MLGFLHDESLDIIQGLSNSISINVLKDLITVSKRLDQCCRELKDELNWSSSLVIIYIYIMIRVLEN